MSGASKQNVAAVVTGITKMKPGQSKASYTRQPAFDILEIFTTRFFRAVL